MLRLLVMVAAAGAAASLAVAVPADNGSLGADAEDGSSWESLYDGCGYTKNCLGIPPDCDQGRNCRAIVVAQWVNGGALHFKMRASDSKWVAVGLGDSPLMYGTAVLECVDDPVGTITAYLSYTPPDKRGCVRVQSKQDPLGTTLKNSKSMNGDIYCEVFRVNNSRVNGKEYNLGVTPYFLQLASGQSIQSTGIAYHGATNRNAAVRSTVLTDYQVLGSVNNWPMRLHGVLMVLAWMFAATVGSMAARYFKAAWGKATICGKAMWFAWHRLFMIATISLHVVAVVAALIFLQGWSSSSGAHGIVGGVTTGLALLQGLGGLLRPAPDHKYRAVFNWAHRCQGFGTHLLAIITIFLAVGLPNARLPSYSFYILGIYAATVVLLHGVHSLTEVQSYYFLIVVAASAVFTIAMMILIVIGPGDH
ncbi:hypothetical protein ONE63_000600 [Megalurothrips usitatus]|uniref:Cytochrome b561 domain-containing protein n=1 Tax=Megalurothrips usitatus TaxID=439358 RepID=A0AAV7Y223_9NEOP|nr:hypothetical protein ONE63_000600 [Megalurothrips usitatus]